MPRVPQPGKPVRGSSSGRPLMAALDLLGHRWLLRVVWELREGPVGFRALAQRCDGVSTAVLRDRCVELTDAGIVEQNDDRQYLLTRLGGELIDALTPIDAWSKRWAGSLRDADSSGRDL
jgi:DNA-binding HxlR family transcriptional regulator